MKVNNLLCLLPTSKALWFRATVCCASISLLCSNTLSCDFVLVSESSTEVFCGCAYSKTTCTTSKKLKTDARLTCTTTSCHGSCRDSSANQLKMTMESTCATRRSPKTNTPNAHCHILFDEWQFATSTTTMELKKTMTHQHCLRHDV